MSTGLACLETASTVMTAALQAQPQSRKACSPRTLHPQSPQSLYFDRTLLCKGFRGDGQGRPLSAVSAPLLQLLNPKYFQSRLRKPLTMNTSTHSYCESQGPANTTRKREEMLNPKP